MVLESVVQYLSELGQNILTAARNFTFKDAIDVAIVTVLLYSAIKLVRETRAGQLVKGIILLIVLFLISYQLDLLMLNAILRAFLSSGIVIVVILFQPEIRKALEQVGHSKVVQSLANTVSAKDKEEGKAETRKAIQGVVDATQILQQLRMGALIVFERQTKLGEIVATGTIIEATPSSQLIANIFFNKAPLHDGGMIIREGPGLRRRLHPAPYQQRERQRRAGHPATGPPGHERELRRRGGGGLRGDRPNLRGHGGQAHPQLQPRHPAGGAGKRPHRRAGGNQQQAHPWQAGPHRPHHQKGGVTDERGEKAPRNAGNA